MSTLTPMSRSLAAYVTAYRRDAAQLAAMAIAAQWFRAGVSIEDAVAWTNLGFLPGEAAPFIAQGVTPAMFEAAEEAEAAAEAAEEAAAYGDDDGESGYGEPYAVVVMFYED